jgi:hypothetical protein
MKFPNNIMRSTLVLSLAILALPLLAKAHQPYMVNQESLLDIEKVDDPALSQAFYGDLDGFPHTYEIRAEEPFTLSMQILQPDLESSLNNISGIIIKEGAKRGRVIEVARLSAKNARWESDFSAYTGDSYRQGPALTKELDPGVYRIEVNTPDNLEKYVLLLGTREDRTIGYFELLGRLVEVKRFFEKPAISVIQSSFVYAPLFFVFGLAALWYAWRRKRTA